MDDGGKAAYGKGLDAAHSLGRLEGYAEAGVTLRDQMAMAALTGILANATVMTRIAAVTDKPSEAFAKTAYQYADAMLAAREERK